MDANALSGDAESADLVDLSKVDSSDKGKKRSSTEFEPSAVKRVKLSYHDPASSRSSSPGRPQNTLLAWRISQLTKTAQLWSRQL